MAIQKVLGVETEYGIIVRGGDSNPIAASSHTPSAGSVLPPPELEPQSGSWSQRLSSHTPSAGSVLTPPELEPQSGSWSQRSSLHTPSTGSVLMKSLDTVLPSMARPTTAAMPTVCSTVPMAPVMMPARALPSPSRRPPEAATCLRALTPSTMAGMPVNSPHRKMLRMPSTIDVVALSACWRAPA